MKRFLALTLAILAVVALSACTGGKGPAGSTSSTYATTTFPTPEDSFYFHFNNVYLIPGGVFNDGKLPTPDNVQETPDCVNGGQTRIYFYEYLQVTTYESGENEIIHEITLDPEKCANTPTAEGLYFGDNSASVEELYGTGATKDGDVWTYKKGNTLLIIQIGNDQVTRITYTEA